MKDLINKIRLNMNMSQEEFAKQLNVSFATANRWENNRAVPNKLAQSKMEELCKMHGVSVYDMIMDKINTKIQELEKEEEKVILFHGSKSGIEGTITPRSRKQCDFGAGFYMGTDPEQALTLICDYEKSKLYIVSVNTKDLRILNVSPDLDWAMIVAYNRGRMEKIKGTPLYNKYRDMSKDKDLIVGSIADDRMFYVIDNFFIGNITDEALIHSLSALELGKQYVAVTQKGCDAVKIECEIELSYLERNVLKEVAESNRSKGISLANKICKDYRREGVYFDEIMDEAWRGGLQ